jgi:release factor glutamine methyltransferase
VIRRFIPQVAGALAPGGLLAMEIGHKQGPQVVALLSATPLQGVRVANDLAGNPRFAFAHAPASP